MKKIILNGLKYTGWTAFALYSVLMVYGFYEYGFKLMEPWLKLELHFIGLIILFKALALNKETQEILSSMN